MAREMPPPTTVNDIYAAAILGVLDDIARTLDRMGDRLAAPAGDGRPVPDRDGGAVPLKEPGVPGQRPPVQPDPEPEQDEPVADDEPMVEPPPRAGRGSSLDAWRAFANTAQVDIDDDMSRDDIVAACELAGVIDDSRRT